MATRKGRPTRAAQKTISTAIIGRQPSPGNVPRCSELLRSEGSVLSFRPTAELAILEAAARVHDLRAQGFQRRDHAPPAVEFRG